MRKRSRIAGLALAALAALCWGLATVMAKGALLSFPPVELLIVQLTASGAFLWTFAILRGVGARTIRDSLSLFWLGLIEPGIAYLLALFGLVDTLASGATLIDASEGIMIALLSAALFREHLSFKFVSLSFTAFAGLTIALGATPDSVPVGDWPGIVLIFLGTLAAAFYVVISGRVLRDRDPMLVLAGQQLAAVGLALAVLPFFWKDGFFLTVVALPAKAWALALISGVIQYALAFWLYLSAMRSLKPSIAGSFLNLVPVFGLIGAFVFLGEELSAVQLQGAAVTVAALLVVSRLETQKVDVSP
jgi:drug/metabolite transporter (DMT)-like permease